MAAGNDIFGKQLNFGRVFQVDEALLTFAGAGEGFNTGALVQGVSFTYGRPVQKIGDLGSSDIHFIVGRPEGQLTINKLATADIRQMDFLREMADICKVKGRNIEIIPTTGEVCEDGNRNTGKLIFSHCLLQGIGGQFNTESLAMASSISIAFLGLSIQGS